MELSVIQREILLALIKLYREKNTAIRGEEIAELIDRNPGTIRNQMQALKALGLVEGVPGPKGGYRPTIQAYDALAIEKVEAEAEIPVMKNGERLEGKTVADIDFVSLQHPELCKANIRIIGGVKEFQPGDIIQIGPTPVNKFVIRGEVIGRDDTSDVLLINVSEMISLPKRPVKEYVKRRMIYISPEDKINEILTKMLEARVNCLPVVRDGQVLGVVTYRNIARAILQRRFDAKADEIMYRKVITIDANATLIDAIKLMNKYEISGLVVMENDKPLGMITRSDVLEQLAKY
ncbi:MAG: CBS domain-containing protein [Archaeoglobi archaeon]|nr:CBS domain-containing protein [Candidatus Mnemosynella sp.]